MQTLENWIVVAVVGVVSHSSGIVSKDMRVVQAAVTLEADRDLGFASHVREHVARRCVPTGVCQCELLSK